MPNYLNNNLINVSIDDEDYLCSPETSIIEICKYAGLITPRFCYHELLSVSGNCRMCLVEVEGLDKPVAACVAEISDGMSILLNSPFTKKARENIVELILLHHPLDCPICDQAGECDLQDQSKKYGAHYTRFYFTKRGTEDKYCGPLIKTIMTRCITCTRCVRFCDEIAGVGYFGTLNRGENTEIGPYLEQILKSEISANVIDLCPVGALNSKPISNQIRPWELKMYESVDLTDSLGANVYIEHKETSIVRISPKTNVNINTSLITDKARFHFDANKINRIQNYYIKNKENQFEKTNFKTIQLILFNYFNVKKNSIQFIIDGSLNTQTIKLFQHFTEIFSVKKIKLSTFENTYTQNLDLNKSYSTINNIENADLILLIGTDPKKESPLLNTRIKNKYNNEYSNIFLSGLTSFNYNVNNSCLHASTVKILTIFSAKNLYFNPNFNNSQKPTFIYGPNFADNFSDFAFFLTAQKNILNKIKTTFISLRCNSETLKTFGIKSIVRKRLNKFQSKTILARINNNNVTTKLLKEANNTLISFTNHPSTITYLAECIVPTLSPLEENGSIYLNLEHRAQKNNASYFLNDNLENIGSFFSYSLVGEIFRNIRISKNDYLIECLMKPDLFQNLRNIDEYFIDIINFSLYKNKTKINIFPIFQKSKNFYQNSNFTLNSEILSSCTKYIKTKSLNFIE